MPIKTESPQVAADRAQREWALLAQQTTTIERITEAYHHTGEPGEMPGYRAQLKRLYAFRLKTILNLLDFGVPCSAISSVTGVGR